MAHDDHGDDHGHDDHGHDGHGHDSSAWVLPPLLVGFVIGIIIVAILGLASGAMPFV